MAVKMAKIMMITGFVLFAVGVLLFFATFPILTGMTKDVLKDGEKKYSLDYKSYEPGDKIYFAGEVEKCIFSPEDLFWAVTLGWIGVTNHTVCLLDVDGDYSFFFLIRGNATGEVHTGYNIYGELTLASSKLLGSGEYWVLDSPDDIHYQIIAKVFFGLIAVAGVFLIGFSLRSGKR